MLTSIRALGRIRNLVFSFFVKRLGGLSQCFFNAPQAYNKFKVLSYKDIELDAVGHGRTVGITQWCPAMPFHARYQPFIQVVNKAAALEWSFFGSTCCGPRPCWPWLGPKGPKVVTTWMPHLFVSVSTNKTPKFPLKNDFGRPCQFLKEIRCFHV